jgi:hypothetical protein
MVRLQVVLDPAEADALARWAASELRDPRDQLRLVLRQELERRGLLRFTERMPTGQEGLAQPDRGDAHVDTLPVITHGGESR